MWCQAQEHNEGSLRNSCPNISSSSTLQHWDGSGRERIEYEADPRHTELIFHQLGVNCSSRSVSTPSEKLKPGIDVSTVLNSADHTLSRSAVDREVCPRRVRSRTLELILVHFSTVRTTLSIDRSRCDCAILRWIDLIASSH